MFFFLCWIDSKDWIEGNEVLGNNLVKIEGFFLLVV